MRLTVALTSSAFLAAVLRPQSSAAKAVHLGLLGAVRMVVPYSAAAEIRFAVSELAEVNIDEWLDDLLEESPEPRDSEIRKMMVWVDPVEAPLCAAVKAVRADYILSVDPDQIAALKAIDWPVVTPDELLEALDADWRA